MNCPHHWDLEPPQASQNGTVAGTCRNCGATRRFPVALEFQDNWGQGTYNRGLFDDWPDEFRVRSKVW